MCVCVGAAQREGGNVLNSNRYVCAGKTRRSCELEKSRCWDITHVVLSPPSPSSTYTDFRRPTAGLALGSIVLRLILAPSLLRLAEKSISSHCPEPFRAPLSTGGGGGGGRFSLGLAWVAWVAPAATSTSTSASNPYTLPRFVGVAISLSSKSPRTSM